MVEVEYIAKNDAAKEAVWLKNFIIDLGIILVILDSVPFSAIIMMQ